MFHSVIFLFLFQPGCCRDISMLIHSIKQEWDGSFKWVIFHFWMQWNLSILLLMAFSLFLIFHCWKQCCNKHFCTCLYMQIESFFRVLILSLPHIPHKQIQNHHNIEQLFFPFSSCCKKKLLLHLIILPYEIHTHCEVTLSQSKNNCYSTITRF